METSQLRLYFNEHLKVLSLGRKSKSSILHHLKSIHLQVMKKHLKQSFTHKSLSSIISKLAQKSSLSIEENIRKQKLKSAILAKKELEDKLLFVSQNIENLQETKSKKNQQEFFEEEKEKATEFLQKVKKFSRMQKETEKFLKAQTEKIKRKAKILEESDLIFAEKMKERREIARLQELEKMREKREKREKDLENVKLSKSFLTGLEKKPLYLKIEENFKIKVEMPELEKRKNELKKKSAFFKSYQGESLKDHLKWYNSFKEETMTKAKESRMMLSQSQNRSVSVNPSYWALKVIQEDQAKEQEKTLKQEEKKKLLERKVKYCELLKELHPPIVNPLKNSFSTEKSTEEITKEKKRIMGSASVDAKKWKPHKFEPNRMVPPPKLKREPKPLSYLEDRRKEKQETNTSPLDTKRIKEQLEQDISEKNYDEVEFGKLHKNAQILEKIARKKEIFMETKPLSVASIQQAASVDKLLVSSIKAKLKVLENL